MTGFAQPADATAAAVEELLIRVFGVRDFQWRGLPGGRNNRAYEVRVGGHRYFLKSYFRNASDKRDRLGHEVAFCRYIWERGGRFVPQFIGAEPASSLALFEFVEGRKLALAELAQRHIDCAIDFIRFANADGSSVAAQSLPIASEACFSIQEHLAAVDRRFERLDRIQTRDDLDLEAGLFVRGELLPLWQRCRSQIMASRSQCELGSPLSAVERCVSPSDFGYHNALEEPDGQLRFLDFEYAGWDDPAKLACDFVNQPDMTPTAEFGRRFVEGLVAALDGGVVLRERIECLMPVYQTKWCCIILNAFLPATPSQALAAQLPANGCQLREDQLHKARQMLDRVRKILT